MLGIQAPTLRQQNLTRLLTGTTPNKCSVATVREASLNPASTGNTSGLMSLSRGEEAVKAHIATTLTLCFSWSKSRVVDPQ